MAWTKLSRRSSLRSEKPSIGIQKNGRLSWNTGTQNALRSPQYVELLYDRDTRRLGIRRVEVEDIDTFQVRKAEKQQSWGISALGALNTIGISAAKAYRRFAKTDGDIVFITVEDAILVDR
jgi:hypothetical protein